MDGAKDGGAKDWKAGATTIGCPTEVRFEMKQHPIRIHVDSQAGIGLVGNTWRDIWGLQLETPPSATFTAKGTTLHRTWSQSSPSREIEE
jgi:hypothetical protein